jgi:putative ABC transport system ATP-binding protein
MSEPALEVRGVHHTFRRGSPGEIRALEDVQLTLETGAFVIVLGRNGSGKSTLLSAIAGTVVPDRGSVWLAGRDVTRWPEHRRASLIGRVYQNPFTGTAPHMTVAANLALALERGRRGGRLARALTRERRREIRERLAALDMRLEERLDTPAEQLSGGERQALTLLMATLVRPSLLLLDEHTAALDPRSAEQVLRLTSDIVERESLTTLMVTHSLQQAVRLGDRVIIMHQGRIAQDFSGARKRRLDVNDLLDSFEQLRNAELLDESAAEMLAREYV